MFLQQNFERLPRFYKVMLLMQIFRGRNFFRYFKDFIKDLNIKIEVQNLMIVFMVLVYILHVSGCLWYAAHYGDVYHYLNWVTYYDIKDETMLVKYIWSLYWATVTCTTVGYGDILPMNDYELVWAQCIILFGVAVFSYILSDLSSKFSEITRTNQVNTEKIHQIEQLDSKFHLGGDLTL